jgi:hypothetical protein
MRYCGVCSRLARLWVTGHFKHPFLVNSESRAHKIGRALSLLRHMREAAQKLSQRRGAVGGGGARRTRTRERAMTGKQFKIWAMVAFALLSVQAAWAKKQSAREAREGCQAQYDHLVADICNYVDQQSIVGGPSACKCLAKNMKCYCLKAHGLQGCEVSISTGPN